MRRLLALALLLFVPTTAASWVAHESFETDAYLEPGESVRILFESGPWSVRWGTNDANVTLTVRTPGVEKALQETRATQGILWENGSAPRHLLIIRHDGPGNARVHIILESEGLAIVETTGLRQLPPEAWTTPSAPAWTILVIALFLAWRRR